MLDVAISQMTTPRWDLSREVASVADHGFASLGMWRPKLPDAGAGAAAAVLAASGVRAASLHWAGGFTGSDGRSFAESVGDALEAVEAAAALGTAAPAGPPPVLVVHSGCRGGHTRKHAARLLSDALAALEPVARREGVVLAVQPLRSEVAVGCSFLVTLAEALDLVAGCGPTVGIALDLWHFGDDPALPALLPRLAANAVLVQVADRCGPPSAIADRLPAGHGTLPLEEAVAALVAHGYRGEFEFDPVGESVEVLGYEGVLGETRLVVEAWEGRMSGVDAVVAEAARCRAEGAVRPGHRRRAAGAGSRRSQASSQAVSRG